MHTNKQNKSNEMKEIQQIHSELSSQAGVFSYLVPKLENEKFKDIMHM